MKRLYFALVFISIAVFASAQELKKLNLEEVIAGGKNYRNFIPEYKNISFRGNTDELVLNESDSIYLMAGYQEKTLLFCITEINKLLQEKGLRETKNLWNIQWLNMELFWLNNGNSIVVFNSVLKTIDYHIHFPDEAKNIDFNPKAQAIVYNYKHNLYVARRNQEPVLVAKGSDKGIVVGQSVHRNEFGINKGVFWAPSGKFLAFYRMDETMVTDYPLVNINTRVAEVKNIKYPMAGMDSHWVSLGVYDLENDNVVFMSTGEPREKYLTNIAWSGDEKNILIAELNRGQDNMKLNVYDSRSGEWIKQLFQEKSDTWVEPENPPLFIPDGKNGFTNRFIWQSERDGFNHLYLYDLDKGLHKQLTKGSWVVTKVLGFDANNKHLFFESTKDGGALNRNLYQVALRNGKITRITSGDGMHATRLSSSGAKAIDVFSNVDTPREISVIDIKERSTEILHRAKNPFDGYEMGNIVMDTLYSADGKTELYSRMILPPNFDATKKYPVVVYVYGGPHAQLVKNSWLGGARMWQVYMAQQGYIAFTMDNRGTPYRGCEFEKVIHRQLGEAEVADQMEGVKYLKSLPYVDADRIGVHGWSYGGFMTINLMQKYPGVFKVGVSGGPVTDWKYYEIMYGERYMDTPDENKEGYMGSNLNERTNDIQGRLLLIHGAMDPVVVWQHSLYFLQQCVKNRKQVDYFVYPGHEHNVLGPDRVHLMQKVTNYFNDFL
ncbi:prolyl tripeptidyl peptidase. Serine peptidase. MEROPS family S09B [Saccharicrinis carchari]|uniref:Prolyl tripeptidyl peptidase. Serine peptidase. MEROPS family S09B n=1 Tax=Saccharicrinis carchari TaxID=1168039 RepID=A0A521E0H0_SACCC|nr:DPP IV N-terminal domain-containing protein [Saccharicrinis carchari]SMO77335.1 prolyl tripeptidyl peptidase. Serine peptidase. MEROPS family S09B [Saccharicrinis carchari]